MGTFRVVSKFLLFQVKHLNLVQEIDHPAAGKIKVVGRCISVAIIIYVIPSLRLLY